MKVDICRHERVIYPGNGIVERTEYCKWCLVDMLPDTCPDCGDFGYVTYGGDGCPAINEECICMRGKE